MKFGAAVAVLIVSLVATSMALPAHKRMAQYQEQPSYYYRAQVLPQRMMYVQQSSPHTHARSTAFVAGDSVGAGSVLKDCIHPEDVASVEQQAAEESLDQGYPAAGAQASAEFEGTFADGQNEAGISASVDVPAPEDPQVPEVPELPQAPVVENQVLEDDSAPVPAPVAPENVPAVADVPVSDDEAKVPREFNFEKPAEAEPEQPAVDSQVAEEAVPAVPEVPALPEVPEVPSVNAEQAPEAPAAPAVAEVPQAPAADAAPAEAPVVAAAVPVVPAVIPAAAPVAPPKRYLPPRKKVTVKLDEQSEAANDDDDVDVDSYRPARIPNARRPAKGNASAAPAKPSQAKAPLPAAGSFFPINFGGTSGGAIAIANSFSTGEGGSATSHAIAYGSPDAARAKSRPVRRH